MLRLCLKELIIWTWSVMSARLYSFATKNVKFVYEKHQKYGIWTDLSTLVQFLIKIICTKKKVFIVKSEGTLRCLDDSARKSYISGCKAHFFLFYQLVHYQLVRYDFQKYYTQCETYARLLAYSYILIPKDT